jgi:hypothetical protein
MKSLIHFTTETQSAQRVYPLFCPIGRLACQRLEAQLMAGRSRSDKRTLPFGQVHFDLLSDLGWSADHLIHGLACTQYTTQGNPVPRSGTEDFGLPRKSPGHAKHNTSLCDLCASVVRH